MCRQRLLLGQRRLRRLAVPDKPDSSKESASSFDPCKDITVAQAEGALGYPVVVTEVAYGCSWGSEENPRLASLSVSVQGDADVVLGPLKGGGGESIQAQGAILVGDQLITVGITQLRGAAVTEDAVAAQAEAGMKLVGSKL